MVSRVCVHVTTASPRAFIARSSLRALPPRSERLRASPQLPPAGRETTCAAVQEPLKRSHATSALPSRPSRAAAGKRSGRGRTEPPATTRRPPESAPRPGRRGYAPSDQRQAATAAPASSIAITGVDALPIGPEMTCAGAQAPAIVREDVSMAVRRSLEHRPDGRCSAGPDRDVGVERASRRAPRGSAGRSSRRPPAGPRPGRRCHARSTAARRRRRFRARPSPASAIRSPPPAPRSARADDQVRRQDGKPRRSRTCRRRARARRRRRCPDPSEAIRGVDPETPSFEMSLGCSSPAADIGKATRTRTAAKSAVRPSMFHSFRELFTAASLRRRRSHGTHAALTPNG